MKKGKKSGADELRSEYQRSDFRKVVRGKYVGRLQKNSNVVIIDPEIADLFPNSVAVNAALRSLATIARRNVTRAKPGEIGLREETAAGRRVRGG